MIKFLFVLIFLIIIIFIFWQKNKDIRNYKKSNFFKTLLIIIIIVGFLFILATSGKFILPQLLSIFKMALPLITKLIGI